MQNELDRPTYSSLGTKQIIYPLYPSSFPLLVTIEEGYSSTGLKRPIIMLERGLIKRTNNESPIFTVYSATYKRKIKNFNIPIKEQEYLKKIMGRQKYSELLIFLKEEEQECKKYNAWLKGEKDRYKSLPNPELNLSEEVTPIIPMDKYIR